MPTASPLTLTALLDRVVRWFPANEAAVDSTARLTYREFGELTARCAAMFTALGAKPGEPVAILAPPSVNFLIAFFGAVRMGALPMMLHTREAAQIMAAICSRIEPRLLVYDSSFGPQAAAMKAAATSIAHLIMMQSCLPAQDAGDDLRPVTLLAGLEQYSASIPKLLPREDDPAAIVLSSGTTAASKAVVHTHRSLVEMARVDASIFGGLRPTDRSLVVASTAFIGCYNAWLPFINGGACCVFLEKFDVAACIEAVKRERITHLVPTPTVWRMILNSATEDADFSSMRQAGFGGEVIDETTLGRIREQICKDVVNVYGSTESGCPIASMCVEDMIGARIGSVGRPTLNGEIRVVTPDGDLSDEVRSGDTGEVLVSSPGLAAGMWRDPEMTRKVFIADDDRRWWRSGDLGHVDDEGFLFLEGRKDDMIISGGLNVFPSFVENILLRHSGVSECAVIGVPDSERGQQIQAFVIARDPTVSAKELDAFVIANGLSYQRPRRYHLVADLPRTATGKINRRTLRNTEIEQTALTPAGRERHEPPNS